MNVAEALRNRQSIRAYLDRPVPRETVQSILDTARWAPSSVNSQPWRVSVLTGKTREELGRRIIAAREAGEEERPDYRYYPEKWEEPYRSRRRACGLALYRAAGVGREDRERQKALWYANYRFFDAPVGLLFWLDRRMPQGAWIDLGIFLQSIMLTAVDAGLGTCPQASLAEFPDIARELLGVSDQYVLACGMALGWPDPHHPLNNYRTEREPVEAFTTWYGE